MRVKRAAWRIRRAERRVVGRRKLRLARVVKRKTTRLRGRQLGRTDWVLDSESSYEAQVNPLPRTGEALELSPTAKVEEMLRGEEIKRGYKVCECHTCRNSRSDLCPSSHRAVPYRRQDTYIHTYIPRGSGGLGATAACRWSKGMAAAESISSPSVDGVGVGWRGRITPAIEPKVIAGV